MSDYEPMKTVTEEAQEIKDRARFGHYGTSPAMPEVRRQNQTNLLVNALLRLRNLFEHLRIDDATVEITASVDSVAKLWDVVPFPLFRPAAWKGFGEGELRIAGVPLKLNIRPPKPETNKEYMARHGVG